MSKIHLGCGKRDFGPGWINIDIEHYDHVDFVCSAAELPVEELDDVELIYASHILEYFDREEGLRALQHWYDILKPNGILRLAVPDFDAMARLYIHGAQPLDNLLGPLYGKMKASTSTGYIYHKTTYNYNDLANVLYDAGFMDVREWDWHKVDHGKYDDHSQAYLPHMDKENGALISLNIQATK